MNTIIMFTFIILWIIFSIIHKRRKKIELSEILVLSKEFNIVNQSLSKKFEELFKSMEPKKRKSEKINEPLFGKFYEQMFNEGLSNDFGIVSELSTLTNYLGKSKKQDMRLIRLKAQQSTNAMGDYIDLYLHFTSRKEKFNKKEQLIVVSY
ncbi:unnamed protein product [marine sediment metagenome]|uniref:Uncharacterized protein n=1 Tax=marine sediment metagenome TaxID=412755 RepID=X1BMB0_9ZZZZ